MDDDIVIELPDVLSGSIFIKRSVYDNKIRLNVWKRDCHIAVELTDEAAKQVADALILCVDQK
jgi:hypothetical protein